MVLEGNPEYKHQLNSFDKLSSSQQAFIHQQWTLFRTWWKTWRVSKLGLQPLLSSAGPDFYNPGPVCSGSTFAERKTTFSTFIAFE